MTMKQWVTDLSGIANLRQETAAMPEPQTDEVLVKINAVSLNFRDVEGQCRMSDILCSHHNSDLAFDPY